jgi:hypothetical protein
MIPSTTTRRTTTPEVCWWRGAPRMILMISAIITPPSIVSSVRMMFVRFRGSAFSVWFSSLLLLLLLLVFGFFCRRRCWRRCLCGHSRRVDNFSIFAFPYCWIHNAPPVERPLGHAEWKVFRKYWNLGLHHDGSLSINIEPIILLVFQHGASQINGTTGTV